LDDRREDADGIAGLFDASGGVGAFEQTSQTRGTAGADGHGDAVTADGSSINPRAVVFYGEIVEEEARFKIVGAVEKEVEAREEFWGVLRGEIGDDAFDGNSGINGAKLLLGGDCLGQGLQGVGFVKERLALKIRRFDKITVEDTETTDASASQQRGS